MKLLEILKALIFGRKTVNGVLSGFQKAVNDLDVVHAQNLAECKRQDDKIFLAQAVRTAAAAEAKRASEARSMISRFIPA